MSSSALPTYTRIQLAQYFHHISLPANRRIYNIKMGLRPLQPDHALGYLELLQKLTLVTVPFENLGIHYSPHRHVDIDPEALFEKIVGRGLTEEAADAESHGQVKIDHSVMTPTFDLPQRQRRGGRGGYCMENNRFFATILHSLGFDVYSVGARVHTPNGYNGWSHMINLVKIADRTYAVDIGFGGSGPTRPIPLCDPSRSDAEARRFKEYVTRPLYSGSDILVKLHKRALNEESTARRSADPAQAQWVYETAKQSEPDANGQLVWVPQYAFTETEFLPADFAIMNWYTSTSPQMWFTYRIVCARYSLDGDNVNYSLRPLGEQEERFMEMRMGERVDRKIVGQMSLDGGVVKRRMGNSSVVVEVCETEEYRVKALEKWFGIRLTAEERRGIKGLGTELKGSITAGDGTTTEGNNTRKRPRS